jgi:hypothetical protein
MEEFITNYIRDFNILLNLLVGFTIGYVYIFFKELIKQLKKK